MYFICSCARTCVLGDCTVLAGCKGQMRRAEALALEMERGVAAGSGARLGTDGEGPPWAAPTAETYQILMDGWARSGEGTCSLSVPFYFSLFLVLFLFLSLSLSPCIPPSSPPALSFPLVPFRALVLSRSISFSCPLSRTHTFPPSPPTLT